MKSILTNRCKYGLMMLELLARRGFMSSTKIFKYVDIPERFGCIILADMKKAGWVTAQRGREGGYRMRIDPELLLVSEVIDFFDGAREVIDFGHKKPQSMKDEEYALYLLSKKVEQVWDAVLASTTVQDLVRSSEER